MSVVETDAESFSEERALPAPGEALSSDGVLARPNGTDRHTKENQQADEPETLYTDAFSTEFIHMKELEESDEALFKLFQQGDQRAFLKLYDRYKSSVFGYCSRALMSAGLDQGIVEDTFQEVFLRIAQYHHTFVGGEYKKWLFTVTRHTCLSAKKKALRFKSSMEQVGDTENLDDTVSMAIRVALSRTDDPLERMAKQEQIDLLLKAIQELPETYREALILSDYEGMTYDEIGKLTGNSLSTIRIRVFRAKARLRKVLLPIIGDEVDDRLRNEVP
jgi:RNA polymerase sigma-70 factor, ECF subfamily